MIKINLKSCNNLSVFIYDEVSGTEGREIYQINLCANAVIAAAAAAALEQREILGRAR